ncbi:hypothetical protein Aduo_018787 [Ancylostoma duodenale]
MQSAGCSSSASNIPTTTASFQRLDQASQVGLTVQTSNPAPSYHQSASGLLANPSVSSFKFVTHSNPASYPPRVRSGVTTNQPAYNPLTQLTPAPLYINTQSFFATPPPTLTAHSVDMEVDNASTSQRPSTSYAPPSHAKLSFASRDLRWLLSTLESVASDAFSSQPRAQPKLPHCQQRLLGAEDNDLLNIAPRLGYRAMTPFEACYL